MDYSIKTTEIILDSSGQAIDFDSIKSDFDMYTGSLATLTKKVSEIYAQFPQNVPDEIATLFNLKI